MVEILKQGQYEPLPVEKQVLIIFAATNGFLRNHEVSQLGSYEKQLYAFFDEKHAEILDEIRTKKVIDDDLKERLKAALGEFDQAFVAG
jgi:F-type H+-transporting ATPase subunit alpha